MPNIDDVFAGKTMKAADLGDTEPVYTITAVETREFKEKDGTTARKLVVTFAGADQQFVCNKTNAKMIAKYYGKDTDDWIDRKIQLYKTDVEFGGEIKEGIRVRVIKSKPVAAAAQSENPADGFDDEVPF